MNVVCIQSTQGGSWLLPALCLLAGVAKVVNPRLFCWRRWQHHPGLLLLCTKCLEPRKWPLAQVELRDAEGFVTSANAWIWIPKGLPWRLETPKFLSRAPDVQKHLQKACQTSLTWAVGQSQSSWPGFPLILPGGGSLAQLLMLQVKSLTVMVVAAKQTHFH